MAQTGGHTWPPARCGRQPPSTKLAVPGALLHSPLLRNTNPRPLKQKPVPPIHITGTKLTCTNTACSEHILSAYKLLFSQPIHEVFRVIYFTGPITVRTPGIASFILQCQEYTPVLNARKFPYQLSEDTLQFSTVLSHDVSTADGLYSALTNLRLCYVRTADVMPLGPLSHRDKQILRKSSKHGNVLGAIRVTRSKFHTQDPQILGATEQNLLARVAWSSEFLHSCLYKI